jgi:hypothetical protein
MKQNAETNHFDDDYYNRQFKHPSGVLQNGRVLLTGILFMRKEIRLKFKRQ